MTPAEVVEDVFRLLGVEGPEDAATVVLGALAGAGMVAYAEALRAERDATLREERLRWEERLQDLQKEFQRQITVLERARDRYKERAETAENAIEIACITMRSNTLAVPAHPTDYQRGYQACADHVTATLTTIQEPVHG